MTACRGCTNNLNKFMSFGDMPIANGFLSAQDFANEYFFELAVGICARCNLFQLIEQPAPTKLFHDNYPFFSRSSHTMQQHFARFANSILEEIANKKDPLVVELGSNDGVFLQHIANHKIRHLGVEPSANVAAYALEQGINTWCSFFNTATANKIIAEYGQAQIITAANVLCHIPDLQATIVAMKNLLAPTGKIIFEDPYLGDVLHKVSYDQIYDEHVFLFSVHAVQHLFAQAGLQLIDVLPQPTHGGSMRYVIAHHGVYPQTDSLHIHLSLEKQRGMLSLQTFDSFASNCQRARDTLQNTVAALHGKRIVGYAATSKSTTILNYCQIGPEHIQYICDSTPLKQGKFTPGTHIPVVAPQKFHADYPDYAILFGWNHQAEILAKEQQFVLSGGQWISLLPSARIMSAQECYI